MGSAAGGARSAGQCVSVGKFRLLMDRNRNHSKAAFTYKHRTSPTSNSLGWSYI